MFAGIYYWFPKVTGRQLNEFWGKVHFWGSLIFINGVFAPMFLQGLAGVSRRLYDGGAQYAHAKPVLHTNVFMSASAFLLLAVAAAVHHQLLLQHLQRQARRLEHWDATTLEWAATTSPPLGARQLRRRRRSVYRGPYEYSVPGHDATDFFPQNEPDDATPPAPATGGGMLPAGAVAQKES